MRTHQALTGKGELRLDDELIGVGSYELLIARENERITMAFGGIDLREHLIEFIRTNHGVYSLKLANGPTIRINLIEGALGNRLDLDVHENDLECLEPVPA